MAVPLTLAPGETRVLAFRRDAAERPHLRARRPSRPSRPRRRAEVRDTRGASGPRTLSDGTTRTVAFGALPDPLAPPSWDLHVDAVGPKGTTPHDLVLDELADWRDIERALRRVRHRHVHGELNVPAGWLAAQARRLPRARRGRRRVAGRVNGTPVGPQSCRARGST